MCHVGRILKVFSNTSFLACALLTTFVAISAVRVLIYFFYVRHAQRKICENFFTTGESCSIHLLLSSVYFCKLLFRTKNMIQKTLYSIFQQLKALS